LALLIVPLYLLVGIGIAIYNHSNLPNEATTQRIKHNQATLKTAVAQVRPKTHLREAVEHRIRTLRDVQVSSIRLADHSEMKPTDYTNLAAHGVDAVVEVDVRTVTCKGEIATDVALCFTAAVRVVLTTNNRRVYSAVVIYHDATRDRYFSKWADDHGTAFATELRSGLDEVATAFVDEIFRRYNRSAQNDPAARSIP
jgi:hypothetical protein